MFLIFLYLCAVSTDDFSEGYLMLGHSLVEYTNAEGVLPFNRPGLSWRVEVLKHNTDYQDLYKKFNLDEAWDSPHNKTLIEKIPSWLKATGTADKTFFVSVVRGKQKFTEQEGERLRVFAVLAKEPVVWTQPIDLPLDKVKQGIGVRWFVGDDGNNYTEFVSWEGVRGSWEAMKQKPLFK